MGVHTASRRRQEAGFTLIELIIVLLISTIILAVAIPRFATREQFEARGFAEQTLSAIRYAQKLAVASGCDIEVNLSSAGYNLKQRTGQDSKTCASTSTFSVDVRNPSLATAFADATPSGITVSGGALSFYYDKIGRPKDPGTDAPLTSAKTITVSGAGSSWTLTVEPESGYVHL